MGCVVLSGFGNIGYSFNRVCAKKSKGGALKTLKTFRNIEKTVILKNFPKNVISCIRYTRNSSYLVCIKSGMG